VIYNSNEDLPSQQLNNLNIEYNINNNNNNNRKRGEDQEKKRSQNSRIEVYFTSGVVGWYRGTLTQEKNEEVIYFDDGDEMSVQDWNKITWRLAKSKNRNKNPLKYFSAFLFFFGFRFGFYVTTQLF
jgi:hypothetical protein